MPALASELRSQFEKEVGRARDIAERAAAAALATLAVARREAFATLDEDARRLRRALRARARQLGGGDMDAGLPHLMEEIAYEQWHRMLFARFLAENGLLMHPLGVAVSLAECAELAREEGAADKWTLATRYAAAMLPGIFLIDDPAVALRLAPEYRKRLERSVDELPLPVFTSDDGLGWAYQFWQSKKKEEVNRSERKIGGADIAPVTQLFTEDYMVKFLLHNSLGAWWAGRHPDSPLVKRFDYLRFKEDGTPAAGTFDGWPARVAEVTMMDPCGGSGHFIVAGFEMLTQMRMEEERLSAAQAGDAVIRDNLFMLEIDPRCTQIAAFNLALAAWKAGGYRELPLPNIACSGIPVEGQLEDWLKLAGDDYGLRVTLERLYHLFKHAPDLGSLINPAEIPAEDRMFLSGFDRVKPFLARALAEDRSVNDPGAALFGQTVSGVARAAELLTRAYTLVTTNVPYLTNRKQGETLSLFCEQRHPDAKADLATVFLERCREFTANQGTYCVVAPQNWLYLKSYEALRVHMLNIDSWKAAVLLGAGGFQTVSGAVVNVGLFVWSKQSPSNHGQIWAQDLSQVAVLTTKMDELKSGAAKSIGQKGQLANPDSRVTLEEPIDLPLLEKYADCFAGILNGDSPTFQRQFWEITDRRDLWVFQQTTVVDTIPFGGREKVILFDEDGGHLRESAKIRREKLHDSDRRGNRAWGKWGIGVSQIGNFPVTLYTGNKFDSNIAVILPKETSLLPAIWAFCKSADFEIAVRRIDKKMNVTNATFAKVPFDLEYWQSVADEAGPLPEPYSNDPTQWLFEGNPADATEPLQVAVARLLGYRWPEQPDDEPDALDAQADADGIVCLPSVAGEAPAHERLRAALAAAFGSDWSLATQRRLLQEAGSGGKSLDAWLCDAFFKQHCALFKNRPFIWHIWDGRKDGFHALVNYHKLDAARLDKLIYTYLGDWITTQRAEQQQGIAGADGRLVAALALKEQLELIKQGEPPYDIYVRWKALHEQPIGWHPDLNDGVRLNIRPFVTAGVLRSKFTIDWKKDRGKNPDGSERHNDRHYTRAEKAAARV